MEGSCEYSEKAVVDSRKGVVLQLGVGRMLTSRHRNKNMMLRKITQGLGLDKDGRRRKILKWILKK
jgi:hypothetical protein